jgi:hypothetical protein
MPFGSFLSFLSEGRKLCSDWPITRFVKTMGVTTSEKIGYRRRDEHRLKSDFLKKRFSIGHFAISHS